MSNNYEIFDALIKEITTVTRYSEEEISAIAGRNKGYISQIRSRYHKSGEQPSTKFIELLKMHFATDAIHKHIASNTLRTPAEDIKKDDFKKDNATIEMRSIEALINTNQILAESHRNLTVSHQSSIENNTKLTNLVTVHVQRETDLTYQEKLQQMVERLAVGLVGQAWSSREEGLKAMGIILSGKKQANLQ